MEVLAVIPARGGSKGLPRKNVLPVAGIPLVGRAILAAKASERVSRVVVSTDDGEIAEVSRRFGSEVLDRPAEISGDDASSESALFHALDSLEKADNYRPDVIVLLQCTAPFLDSADIDGTIALVAAGQSDSAFAAVPFHHFLWSGDENGRARGVNHSGGPRLRRQDLQPEYLEAGSVYAMRVDVFRQAGHRFCGRIGFFESEADRNLEIDSATELAKAQLLAPLLAPGSGVADLPEVISCVVFDFDGVITDNRVLVSESGEETVLCDRGDGLGIAALRELAVPMLVLSRERNPVVGARCRKLNLPVLQGIDDKLAALTSWLAEEGRDAEAVVYVGNDVNDADCFRAARCAVGPRDAHADIVPLLRIRLSADGGRGAVRELCDLIASGIRSSRISVAPANAAVGSRS